MLTFQARCIPLLFCAAICCARVQAQAVHPTSGGMLTELVDDHDTATEASTNDTGPRGIVPVQRGFNASLIAAGQHDSADGWQSILTPNVAYRFNRHFSANVGLPVYAFINTSKVTNVRSNNVVVAQTTFVTQHLLLGDTALTGEFQTHALGLDYTLDAIAGLPTGDDKDGLGAGQLTYSFNNHFERPLTDWLTPDLELGIGDNPNGLDDQRAHKNFQAIGTAAHFQAGLSFSLPHDISFSTDAYEDLPLAPQTVTSQTVTGRKGHRKTTTTSKQESLGEDNGFLNTLDVPLTRHVTVSGVYNRSLRNHDDIAGMSLTFTLRPTPPADDVH